jgi:hypothetical protein
VGSENTEDKARSGAHLHRSDTAIQRHAGGREIETGHEDREQTQVQPVGAEIVGNGGSGSEVFEGDKPSARLRANSVGIKNRRRRTTREMASGASGAKSTEGKHRLRTRCVRGWSEKNAEP